MSSLLLEQEYDKSKDPGIFYDIDDVEEFDDEEEDEEDLEEEELEDEEEEDDDEEDFEFPAKK